MTALPDKVYMVDIPDREKTRKYYQPRAWPRLYRTLGFARAAIAGLYGNGTPVVYEGTVKWKVMDDNPGSP